MSNARRATLAFTIMGLLLVTVGVTQSPSVALAIFNLCLISAIMSLGVNIQWGYAGLFNVGTMGFAALGGVAGVLGSAPPVAEAWSAGGTNLFLAALVLLITIAAAVLVHKNLPKSPVRAALTAIVILLGIWAMRAFSDTAIADIEATLPPVDDINLARQALTARQQRVPPPLALMFAMAEGTIKKLEAPSNAGWFVVLLDEIIPGEVDRDDPAIAQARTELGRVAGQEFAEQLDKAIQKEVGVTRNDNAIRAVVEELTGQGR